MIDIYAQRIRKQKLVERRKITVSARSDSNVVTETFLFFFLLLLLALFLYYLSVSLASALPKKV